MEVDINNLKIINRIAIKDKFNYIYGISYVYDGNKKRLFISYKETNDTNMIAEINPETLEPIKTKVSQGTIYNITSVFNANRLRIFATTKGRIIEYNPDNLEILKSEKIIVSDEYCSLGSACDVKTIKVKKKYILIGDRKYEINSEVDIEDILQKIGGTASIEKVLEGETFTNDDKKILTGTMKNNGDVTITPNTQNQTKPSGYYNSLLIKGDTNLKPENIKKGINIFGITGNCETQDKNVYVTKENVQGDIRLFACDKENIYELDPYTFNYIKTVKNTSDPFIDIDAAYDYSRDKLRLFSCYRSDEYYKGIYELDPDTLQKINHASFGYMSSTHDYGYICAGYDGKKVKIFVSSQDEHINELDSESLKIIKSNEYFNEYNTLISGYYNGKELNIYLASKDKNSIYKYDYYLNELNRERKYNINLDESDNMFSFAICFNGSIPKSYITKRNGYDYTISELNPNNFTIIKETKLSSNLNLSIGGSFYNKKNRQIKVLHDNNKKYDITDMNTIIEIK